ncbi:MAG: amidohydrolase [Chitinophagaceae bacterium]|nr:amidohydrolase [Chitinophagaceae bacterium]
MSSITISLIQTRLAWEDKEANLRHFSEKLNALSGKTQLAILPEMFSTGFSMQPEKLAETMDGPTVTWMKQQAKQHRMILTGSVIIEDGTDDDGKPAYFNRLLWVLPNGQTGYYDKKHRFAFAGEDQHYQRGHRRFIASVNGWRINLLICYDLRFPVWARQAPQEPGAGWEYDLLLYVANWPQRRNHAWKTLLQARAIENQCYVAGVNRIGDDGNGISHSGDSMVVDPLGQIIANAGDADDNITVTLQKEDLVDVRTKFPFWKDADSFLILPDEDQG